MQKKEQIKEYILMYKNDEVLSFSVEFHPIRKIHIIKKLEHFEEAPYCVLHPREDEDSALLSFFNTRSIAPQRYDYKRIIEATGCRDDFELAFKGHGLSLTSHYWYKKEGENLKYEDINFFTNKWDDTFGRAVLNKDYQSLKTCDLNVPDIVTPGWAVKGWVWDNGPKLYKLARDEEGFEEALGEVLGSNLARRIFNDDEVVHYELEKIGDTYASVSPAMLNIDEELIPLSSYFPESYYPLYANRNRDKETAKKFFKILKEDGYKQFFNFFVKLTVVRHLSFLQDLHFDNISVIKNNKTGKVRIAPLYDLAGAFGTSKHGRGLVSNLNKGTYLILFFMFNDIDQDWDYSWYDPKKLEGFEDEIVKTLSVSKFYTPELLSKIIDIYHYQKDSLDKIAKKS